jgi:hypothetical protein
MLMDELLGQLKITCSVVSHRWNWETDEYCSEDDYDTPSQAYEAFVAAYHAGELVD